MTEGAKKIGIGTRILSAGLEAVKAGLFDAPLDESEAMREVYERYPILKTPPGEGPPRTAELPSLAQILSSGISPTRAPNRKDGRQKNPRDTTLLKKMMRPAWRRKKVGRGRYLRPSHLSPKPLTATQAETYKENLAALARILAAFEARGWTTSPMHLASVYVTSPDGKTRFWFQRANGKSYRISRRAVTGWDPRRTSRVIRKGQGKSYREIDAGDLVKGLLRFLDGSHLSICGMPCENKPPGQDHRAAVAFLKKRMNGSRRKGTNESSKKSMDEHRGGSA